MNTTALTTTSALLALGLFLSPTAQAGTLIGSASATLDQLSYRLIDLDPNDGITPAVLFSGQWGGVFGSTGTIFDLPRNDTTSPVLGVNFTTEEPLAPQGPLMATPSLLNVTSADGRSTLTVANGSFTATTQMSTDDLVSASRQLALPVDELGQTSPGYYLTGESLTAGRKGATMMASPDGIARDAASGYPLIRNPVQLTPNTLLLINGHFSASAFGDRSTLASLPIDSVRLADGGSAASMGWLMMNLSDSDTPYMSPGNEGTISSVTLGQNVVMTRDGVGYTNPDITANDYIVPVDGQTLTQSRQWDWSLQYMNAEASAKTLYLDTFMEATVRVEAHQLDYTTVPEVPPVIIDPDVGTIPEPGTYALMGLGLVGIALVRRHAAR